MSNLKHEQLFAAADALQREAKRMQSIAAAAEVLKDAGTLAALVGETERRLAKLQAEVSAAEGALHLARHSVERVEREMAEEQARASAQAAAHRQEAEVEALRIRADAVKQAKDIMEGAKAEAGRVADTIEAAHKEAEQRLTSVNEQVRERQGKLALLDAELVERNQRLALARSEAARIVQGVG